MFVVWVGGGGRGVPSNISASDGHRARKCCKIVWLCYVYPNVKYNSLPLFKMWSFINISFLSHTVYKCKTTHFFFNVYVYACLVKICWHFGLQAFSLGNTSKLGTQNCKITKKRFSKLFQTHARDCLDKMNYKLISCVFLTKKKKVH